ncbi:MAG: hypothetical protein IIT39_02075 [Clostridia bacterium]|nr:hypothetical protein [Clostridia bacterium]
MPHKKPIASETDARKMKSSARLGGLKEAPASIGGEYFTGVYMILRTVLDIFREAPNGVLQGGSPVGFVWGISIIVGVISVYKGSKKH